MPAQHVRIAGTRRQVGQALGKLARPLMSAYLDQSETWETLRPWREHPYLDALAAQARAALPAVWEEFEGLAEGLDMPLADALLWNCRGDLLHKTTDGCTSAALKSADGTRWIGHNEDGDPYLLAAATWWMWRWMTRPAISASTTPAPCPAIPSAPIAPDWSRPSTTCARANGTKACRACSWRAALDCATLDEAVQLLRATPCAGGFHHTLGSAQDARLFSVEVLPGDVSIQEIGARYGHANHMIHADTAGLPQVVTDSSRARQHRIEGIVDSWSPATGGAELLAALHDTEAHCRSCARTGMTPMARTRWPPPCLRSATAKSRCACTTASRARRSRWT